MSFLLDTNILSELIDEPDGSLSLIVLSHGLDRLWTSVICEAELIFGLEKRPSRKRADRIKELLTWLTVRSIDRGVAVEYSRVRTQLEQRGTPIGQNDYWIAAHALANNAGVVTANIGEFSRIPGLHVENWLRDPA